MQKFWSIVFGAVLGLAGLISAASYFVSGWWLPKNVSSFGAQVNFLFYLILWITAFFYIVTEALLVYFMYKYEADPAKPAIPVDHSPEAHRFEHRLEVFWTAVPAAILLFIALVQIRAWADIKYHSRMPAPDAATQQMEVSAKQWEWRIRYPSARRMESWEKEPSLARDFSGNDHHDDVHAVNEVHTWKGDGQLQRVLIHLKSQDVLHSLFFPNLRLKQDAVPGRTIPVWFAVEESNAVKIEDPKTKQPRWVEEGFDPVTGKAQDPSKIWEVACAEYCGTRHSLMRGKLYVHKDKKDYLDWLQHAEAEQNRTTSPSAK